MPLNKQYLAINFAQGLDTKTDPWQVSPGKFLSLENAVFDKGGLLKKRNGFASLTTLSNSSSYLTTFSDNLLAIGNSINSYNSNSSTWASKGSYQPLQVSTLPLLRNSLNQTQCDTAIASNGLVCTVYSELNASTTTYKYVIANSSTGQNVQAPAVIPVASGTVTGSPRVFFLGNYFIIVFTNVISATSHLQYVAINSSNPSVVSSNTDIASSYVSTTTLSFDGVVSNNRLYIAYNTTTGGQAIKVAYLTSQLTLVSAVTFSGRKATLMTLASDASTLNVFVSFYDSSTSTAYTLIVDKNLNTVLAPTQFLSSGTVLNLASAAENGTVKIFYEVSNAYSYDSGIPSNYIDSKTVTSAGTVGSAIVTIRSLGLASKAFIVNGTIYFLGAYQSPYQNTYFLVNGSTSTAASPQVVGKLAYENGGGYLTTGLPSVSVLNGTTASLTYLYKDFIEPISTSGNSTQTTTGGVYSQTGVNLATFTFNSAGTLSAEVGSNLHLSGGFLWVYDGNAPVEHNFFLWPDSVEATWSASGGSMHAQPDGTTNTNAYYYLALYTCTDNQGNIFRSATSLPVAVTTTGSGTSGSITLNVPTYRLTYKTNVKVELYRWSIAQQNYYQVTSLTSPTLSSTTSDSISFVDTLADASILGNSLVYTTGGVVEDINAPASNILTLFDTRLWLVDAEDPNLLWFSKQVIEATPVEMSDLFTFYVAPTTGVQGSTGPITALAPMDDKLIIFKQNAIYYLNGSGPDNTGANNGYSQPIFITSTVGCSNPSSIVFQPNGLMFQSSKGIWLLKRDLTTEYIGAPVELYNSSTVESAVAIPTTNQIRFTLTSGVTLMYDYYYGQWGTFANIPAVSSCIYQNLHTFINKFGQVYQESPGTYLDGTNPVLMQFTTSWLNLAGLIGYQRIYDFYILGQYYSPHTLSFSLAYDFSPASEHGVKVIPENYNAPWGGDSTWGQSFPWGGTPSLERWRIHPQKQTCSSFQISMQENFDSTYNVSAGAGLTLSTLNLRLGIKKGVRPVRAANSAG